MKTRDDILAWVDKHNDVWVFPGDGEFGFSYETEPFTREYIEKKWGPLEPLVRQSEVEGLKAQVAKLQERVTNLGWDVENARQDYYQTRETW